MFTKPTSGIFFQKNEASLEKTTRLCIAAHHDDIELMAINAILDCYNSESESFTAVVSTDGGGSPRSGDYAFFTDDEMKLVRRKEQLNAAKLGKYYAQIFLDYTSSEIKNTELSVSDYVKIIEETKPEILYTHNPFDKHDTHVAVCLRVCEALKRVKKECLPKKVYGCEVWRDLDWLPDERKTVWDVSERPALQRKLIAVFESQVAGGKRYDLAADGRRKAHATYYQSHGVDNASRLAYAIDMTDLLNGTSVEELIEREMKAFSFDVTDRFNRLTRR
jgi:LmbE family N-acetylglucosaminyl deacetylase